MTAAASVLRPGDVFHQRYTIVRCIAAGGMGSVYEVVHSATRRRCALKVMLPALVADAELRARFQAEAAIAAQIGSEYIVDVLDAGIDAPTGTPFIVMELLVGEELCDRLMRLGPMPPAEAVELSRQAALALDRTHAAGIIHRDLKPENFFVAVREDGSVRMKILDFGIAKVVAESTYGSRQTGTMGTPLYMPPEQVDGTGNIHHQADLYSFAQVAYAMLVGEAYFDEDLRAAGGVFGLLQRVVAGPREPMSARARRRRNVALPPAVDAWFAKATARRPADRFERATAQVAALAEALGVPLPAAALAPYPVQGPAVALSLSSGAFPAVQLAQLPQLTGVPVSTDATGRRRGAAPRRWALPVAASALAVAIAVLVWLALDVSRSGAPAAADPAAASGASATSGAAAGSGAPRVVVPAAPVTAASQASSSAAPPASGAPVAGASASAAATAPHTAPASTAPAPAVKPTPAKPSGKQKSVLDVGP